MNPLKLTRTRISRRSSQIVLTGALLLGASTLTGCNNAGEGLFTGAILGTLTGLALGSLDGNAGEGALTGLIIGASSGAVIGDANERDRENSRYRGSDHRYDNRNDHRYNDGYRSNRHRSSRGRYNNPWWEDQWCE